ncbi:hypothetical protein CsSME_00048281 [Camellia sinensis var. sinensis]
MADHFPHGGGPPQAGDEPYIMSLPPRIRPFDPERYDPQEHILPPATFYHFTNFERRAPPDLLLREPESHLSHQARELTLNTQFVSGTQHIFKHIANSLGIQLTLWTYSSFSGHIARFSGTQLVSSCSTRGYGSILAREWYTELPDVVHHIVDEAGFELFCAGISRYPASRTLIGVLVERWWDTTKSFHFSTTRDMTMTPYGFSMLTGLDVTGRPVPYDADMVRYTWFPVQYRGTSPKTIEEIEQYARGFLMFLLGTTLFSDRGSTVGLYLLSASVDLSQLWVYAYFSTLAPELKVEVPLEIPYSHRFEGQCRPRPRETLPYLRQYFDTVRAMEEIPGSGSGSLGDGPLRDTRFYLRGQLAGPGF